MLRQFQEFFLPHFCVLCHEQTFCEKDLCAKCKNDLPIIKSACKVCAKPLSAKEKICGTCLVTPPPFARTVALFQYQTPIDYLITALKFSHKLVHAEIIGQLLTTKLMEVYQKEPLPEVIIPVPLHKARLENRGFNQALEIARPISKQLKIPIDKSSCMRILQTSPQAKLAAKERHHNIKNAFAIIKPIVYQHIAVIDDVVTTGNTVRELCQTLMSAQAMIIDVWCFARA